MNRSELRELVRNGESSGVEFKRADVRPERLAREIADEEEARLYMQSGRLQYDRRPVPGSSLDDLDRRRRSTTSATCGASTARRRAMRSPGGGCSSTRS